MAGGNGRRIRQVLLVGSLTSFRYVPSSDLDVTVVGNWSEEELKLIQVRLAEMNGKPAEGTEHPVNFYVMAEPPEPDRFDAAYDVLGKKWLKPPSDWGVDLTTVHDHFKNAMAEVDVYRGEAWRDLLDAEALEEALKRARPEDKQMLVRKLEAKMNELDRDVEALSNEYEQVHRNRIEGFKRYLGGEHRGKVVPPSPNLVPENVAYKLMERYHYLGMLQQMHKLAEESKDLDLATELVRIRQALANKDSASLGSVFGYMAKFKLAGGARG